MTAPKQKYYDVAVLGASMGVVIGLLSIWPFGLVFVLLGLVASLAIWAITGYEANPFLIWAVEFVFSVLLLYLGARYYRKKLM